MKLNDAGLKLIRDFEGCVLMVYPDPGTKNRPYTAGVGHAGPDVQTMHIGDPITEAQAEEWLRQDTVGTAMCVDIYFKGVTLTQNQFDALVSFAFNIGSWRKTHLFLLAKDGHLEDAAKLFPLYNTAAGKVLKGLTRRRLAEQKLFNTKV